METFLRYVERGLDGMAIIGLYNAIILAFDIPKATSIGWSLGMAAVSIIASAVIAVERVSRWGRK